MQSIAFFQHLEHFQAGAYDSGSDRVREQIRTGALTQHVDDFFLSGCESAHGATECFT